MKILMICLIAATSACVTPRHCQKRMERSLATLDALNQRALKDADLRPFKRAAKSILRCGDADLYQQMADDENPYRCWVGQCGLAQLAESELSMPHPEGPDDIPDYIIEDFDDLVSAFLQEMSRQ